MSRETHNHKKCGTLREKLFSTSINAEIYIQRAFFDNKKAYQKLLHWKSKWQAQTLLHLLYIEFFFLTKLKCQILVVFQSSSCSLILGKF
jgi:uncharacterized protein with ParB-like and HNH nuclease domain